MNSMKTSPIFVAVVIAILIFILMVVPISADTSISAMVDSCECNCYCNTVYIQSSELACCSISDGSFCDCILSDVPDNEAMLPDYTTLNLDIHKDPYVQSISPEIDEDTRQILEQESSRLLPAKLSSEYHCRNSLNSEEPLLS